jgi:hypothetical protein
VIALRVWITVAECLLSGAATGWSGSPTAVQGIEKTSIQCPSLPDLGSQATLACSDSAQIVGYIVGRRLLLLLRPSTFEMRSWLPNEVVAKVEEDLRYRP